MNLNVQICSKCQIEVLMLQCGTCKNEYRYQECIGCQATCQFCQEKLKFHCRLEEDLKMHKTCWRNIKRGYYHCHNCDKYYCRCIETCPHIKCQLSLNLKKFRQNP